MRPVSSGSRSASSAARGNSGSSSRTGRRGAPARSRPAAAVSRRPPAPPRSRCGAARRSAARPALRRSGRPGWRRRRFPAPRHAHGRQQAGKALRQHRLARARRAHHQQAVAAGRGDLQRALGAGLALDVGQVGIVRAWRPARARQPRPAIAGVRRGFAAPRARGWNCAPRPAGAGRGSRRRAPARLLRAGGGSTSRAPRRAHAGPGWWPARRAPAAARPTATARRRTRGRPAPRHRSARWPPGCPARSAGRSGPSPWAGRPAPG
jgi:hypothetical protein